MKEVVELGTVKPKNLPNLNLIQKLLFGASHNLYPGDQEESHEIRKTIIVAQLTVTVLLNNLK